MKIYGPILPSESAPPAENSPRSGGTPRGDFSEVLKKAVAKPVNEAPKSKAASQPVNQKGGGNNQNNPLLNTLSSVLDLMDEFAAGLGDLKVTLKDLEPMAKEMQGLLDELKQGLGPEVEADLLRLAQEVNAQAQAEILKFHRGDYL